MSAAEERSFAGKDWLTEPEAAAYCGVCLRKFQTDYAALGITPRRFMGKKLYSKAQLFELIEASQPWQDPHSSGATVSLISPGRKAANDGAALSARLRPVPLRKSAPRKKLS